MITVSIVPVLKDNYAYILSAENGDVAVLDPGEAKPIITALEERNLKPAYILNTHHHGDHIAGNTEIKSRYSSKIIGPESDAHRIPDIDIPLKEGDGFPFGDDHLEIFDTPGHTKGGILYYLPKNKIAFTGDTLFLMGCGRLFEGTALQMWSSLEKIMALPDDTLLYCGHEYTLDGAKFCLSVEPDNTDLKKRYKLVESQRANHQPTVPALLSLEKQTNVFLRAGSAKQFEKLRTMKNSF